LDTNVQNPDETDRTHGIHHWQIKDRIIDGDYYTLNIWDFGGQDYYHATHSAALSVNNSGNDEQDNTLYLLVWRKNKPKKYKDDEQQMSEDYWLGFIQLLAERTVVNLVQTHTDSDGEHRLESRFFKHFNIVDSSFFHLCLEDALIFSTKYKTKWERFNTDLDTLIKEISQKVKIPRLYHLIRETELPRLSGKGTKKPKAVWKRKDLISELNKSPLIKDLIKNNTKYKPDYKEIVRYVHKCGELMSWENDDHVLNENVVIDIEQFHKELYRIILKPELINNGEFEWNEKYKFHMHYLKYHDLVFKKEGENNIWVAPQYLPPEPDILTVFKDKTPLVLKLRFPYYMPRYLITRFIVQTYTYGINSRYWKYGCISTIEGALIKVTIDNLLQEIYIHIDPNETNIQSLINRIFSFFASFGESAAWELSQSDGVDVAKSIKPNIEYFNRYEDLEISSDEVNYVTYKKLRHHVNAQKNEIIEEDGKIIPITSIMKGLFFTTKVNAKMKKIFFSYSKNELKYCKELKSCFANLKRQRLVETFYDGEIVPGKDWNEEIKKQLHESDIVLCLLSRSFMESEYIWKIEMETVAKKIGKDSVVPIFISSCDFSNTFLSQQNGLPNIKHIPDTFEVSNHDNGTIWIAMEQNPAIRDFYYNIILEKLIALIKK